MIRSILTRPAAYPRLLRLRDVIAAIYAQRWRGFRTVNVLACATAVVLALGVYAFKADAGKEGVQIRDIDRQIAAERKEVTLLRAEVAHLEQPARLEHLSVAYLGLQPQDARKEASVEGLTELSHHTAAAPAQSMAGGVPEQAR